MKPIVHVVDYGLGNLFSVERALRYVGAEVKVTADPSAIALAGRILLPGVGAFGEGMDNLKARGLDRALGQAVASGAPVLGICLGMQLLMSAGEEMGVHQGLGLIKGKVVRFPDPLPDGPQYKIPHIGWNGIYPAKAGWKGTILDGLKAGDSMYFVHSYVVAPEDPSCVLAETTYGSLAFCSAIKKDNLSGCQFHPEKSGSIGLEIYRNFLKV